MKPFNFSRLSWPSSLRAAFNLNKMSFRSMLLIITGALTLMVVGQAALNLSVSAGRLSDIRQLRNATQVTTEFFRATEALALERDVALSLLTSRDRDNDELLLPRLAESRSAVDDKLEAALAALGQDNSRLAARWQERLSAEARDIRALRGEIDRALKLAPGRRDGALAARWSQAAAQFMTDSEAFWQDYVRRYVNIDATVAKHLSFNQMLRVIFDYSGRERSLVAQVLSAGSEATPAQAAALYRGDGVLATSWSRAFTLANQGDLYGLIKARYDDAKSQYDVLHDMLEGDFFTPGAGSQSAFPLSAAFWLELSDQALESLNALRQVSRNAMMAHVDALIAETERAMLMQGVILMIALALCMLSFWVIVRRVVRPIEGIVSALVSSSRGESADFIAADGAAREIAELIDVLHVFQEKMEDVRRTAAELDRSERSLRSVVDNAVDGLLAIDAKGVIQVFNPACEGMFGFAASEVIGKNVSMLMPEPHRSGHDGYLARYAQTGKGTALGVMGREFVAVRKDGAEFPVEISISGVKTDDGQQFFGIIRDASARKAAEKERTEYMAALERSNKELDDFAYIASHDLKEPLRGIHNHSRFLMEDNADKLDEESVNRLNRLLHLSQRMERLVNDLLYFSRLGRHDLAIQNTDVNAVIIDIESTLDHLLAEKGARISIAGELPTIRCDKTRITEVFRNLIVNAIKYNDKDDKKVEVGMARGKLTPSGAMAKRAFYVADNGCGIAPEFHQEVFRIFKRLQGRKSEQEGTGVGLTFVKKIIERHGGEIWIESTPGEGATFYFTLETPDDTSSAGQLAA